MDDAALSIGLIAAPLRWELWPRAKAMLIPAIEMPDQIWEDVEARLMEATAQLGAVMEGGDLLAAMVLRTIDTKAGPMTEVFLIGGREHERWAGPLTVMLERHARDNGRVGLRAWGRAGWVRTLPKHGWRPEVVAFEKVF